MEIWEILKKIRDDVWLRNFGNNFKKLQDIINILNRASPFIGRIVTQEKIYAGRIEKLELNGNVFEFKIIDCDGKGKSNNDAKVYQEKILLDKLKDIQIFGDRKGKPLWLKDLLDQKMEVKND